LSKRALKVSFIVVVLFVNCDLVFPLTVYECCYV